VLLIQENHFNKYIYCGVVKVVKGVTQGRISRSIIRQEGDARVMERVMEGAGA
jgi:hypothetical protein